MNFLAPYSWLSEYCETKLTPQKLAARISLSGPSVERLYQEGDEWMFDIETTTNRIDMFSIAGLAREIGAITECVYADPFAKEPTFAKASKTFSVRVEDPLQCRRYAGIMLDSITVCDSPEWLQRRLVLCGLRPINNVVDITNYVMLEYGQPMHAFDAVHVVSNTSRGEVDFLQKEITVRQAVEDETLETLDGEIKKLKSPMLVIADHAGPLAIAGIKGGARAGISGATRTIILESANFDPVSIRKTSRALDMRTDSSGRYEKNIGPGLVPYALVRAADLLCQHASGRICSSPADVYKKKSAQRSFSFPLSLYERVVGLPIVAKEAKATLIRLGFSVREKKTGTISISVPFWREADIENPVDFVEEIARVKGYTSVPSEPLKGELPMISRDPVFFWEQKTKQALCSLGWTECINYSLLSKTTLQKANIDVSQAIKVHNPLSQEFEYLRPRLIPSLCENIASNEQKKDDLRLFELSNRYIPRSANDLPDERLSLAGASMRKGSVEELYRDTKGALEYLGRVWFGGKSGEMTFHPLSGTSHYNEEGQGAKILFNKEEIGMIGGAKKQLLRAFDIKTPVVLFHIDFAKALPLMSSSVHFAPVPKYPAIVRDTALVVDKKNSYSTLVASIRSVDPLIADVSLCDVYENPKLGNERRSLTFRVTYRSLERTLQASEVDTLHQKVVDILQNKFFGEIR